MDSDRHSFVKCVNRLVAINSPSAVSRDYGARIQFNSARQKRRLKRKIYDALFDKDLKKKYRSTSILCHLLNEDKWDEDLVVAALLFRMCSAHRQFAQAQKLESLVKSLSGDEKQRPVLRLLLCLTDLKSFSKSEVICRNPSRQKKKAITPVDDILCYGDTDNHQFRSHYLSYPSWVFKCNVNNPLLMSSDNLARSCLTETQLERCKQVLIPKNKRGLMFVTAEDPEDWFTQQNQKTLFGGLVHSNANTDNVSLSLPGLTPNGKLDLFSRLLTKEKLSDDDEGFVSRGETPSPATSVNSSLSEAESESPLFSDDQPYHGYRMPRYEVGDWNRCLAYRRNKCRSWEKIRRKNITRRWFFTEAGRDFFDSVWKKRWMIVVELATALSGGIRKIPFAPSLYQWVKVKEEVLVRNSVLVMVGVPSDVYQLNTLAQMFLSSKKIHLSGVTPSSVHSLLIQFAVWGTSYWRLSKFSSSALNSNLEAGEGKKGVIFKAFCDGIRSYLHGYQRNVLSCGEQHRTLQQLALSFRNLGTQINYVCQLCMCGSPDSPQEHFTSLVHPDFPLGVGILSYLYREALHCTQTADYLVLLFLLRKCCVIYLQFVQAWVFRGSCYDVAGEFLLRVKVENQTLRDRRRWTDYVQGADEEGEELDSSVPNFLAPVAAEIFNCGKTVELMQLICPQHFLCTNLVSAPRMLVTFSAARAQAAMREWRKFDEEMSRLASTLTARWQEREKDLLKTRRDDIKRAREFYEGQMQEEKRTKREALEEIRTSKREELLRLKKQAEDAAQRKREERQRKVADDAAWMKKVLEKEEKSKEDERRLLDEAKQELIDHYEELGREAEKRRTIAEWKIRRHKLREKRIEFAANDLWTPDVDSPEDAAEREVRRASMNTPPVGEVPADDKDPKLRGSSLEDPGSNEHEKTETDVVAVQQSPDIRGHVTPEAESQTVGSIFDHGDTGTDGPSYSEQRVGETDLSSVVPRPSSRKVEGKHVSMSSVGGLMRPSNLCDPRQKPFEFSARNVIGQHSSQSTVQQLMYYQSDYEAVDGQPNSMSEKFDENNKIPVKSVSRAAGSTVQFLMYPEVKESLASSVCDDVERFQLVLLPAEKYRYESESIARKLKCTDGECKPADQRPVDLYENLMGNFAGLYSTDDVTDDEITPNVAVDFHTLPVLLKNLVVRPIKAHSLLVNRCAVDHFMTDLELPRHFEALRHFLLLEDGEFGETLSSDLFEKVHSGCRPSLAFNPFSLDSMLSRAIQSCGLGSSSQASHLRVVVKSLPPAFSSTDLFVLNCIELRYVVDWPRNVVLNEACHSKYNRVLSFLLQLKHVLWSLNDACKRLKRIADGRYPSCRVSPQELRKLHIYRHEMHNFVKVMQGYVSTQVLHVCWQEFQDALRNDLHSLDDLYLRHMEYINRCVLRCLLAPKAQNVMNVICDTLKCILRFRAQLSVPTTCSFSTLSRTYLEFTRFSNFLFRVVSKLVERGYQPHLEDFLIRLNFNGFYKT